MLIQTISSWQKRRFSVQHFGPFSLFQDFLLMNYCTHWLSFQDCEENESHNMARVGSLDVLILLYLYFILFHHGLPLTGLNSVTWQGAFVVKFNLWKTNNNRCSYERLVLQYNTRLMIIIRVYYQFVFLSHQARSRLSFARSSNIYTSPKKHDCMAWLSKKTFHFLCCFF